jgi:hypothetical protein
VKENTAFLYYKDQFVNVEVLIVKAGGTYSYHWFLKGYTLSNTYSYCRNEMQIIEFKFDASLVRRRFG